MISTIVEEFTLISIHSVKVNKDITASQVLGQFDSVLASESCIFDRYYLKIVCSRIANRNWSTDMCSNVILHIPNDCLHIPRADRCGLGVIDNLISSKQSKHIVVSFESFNNGEYMGSVQLTNTERVIQVSLSVSCPWLVTIEVLTIQR